MGDLTVGLDEVAGVDRGLKLNVVVGTEQALVAVTLDQQLGGHIAEQVHHMRAVHQVAAIVCVLRGHAQADQRSILPLFHVNSTPKRIL